MKRFLRTIAGKTILFILCVFSAIILVGSVVGVIGMINEDIYTASEEDILESRYNQKLSLQVRGLVYTSVVVENKTGKWEIAKGTELPDSGNMVFQILDDQGEAISSSKSAIDFSEWKYCYDMILGIDQETGIINKLEFIYDGMLKTEYYYDESGQEQKIGEDQVLMVQINLKDGLPESDQFRTAYLLVHAMYVLRYAIFVIAFISLLISIASFVALMSVAGRRPDSNEIYPGPLNNIPSDIMLAALFAAAILAFSFFSSKSFDTAFIVIACIVMMTGLALFIGFCMNAAVKIKQRRLLKTTLVYYVLKGIWIIIRAIGRGIRMIPLIWKTVLLIVAISVIELIVIFSFNFHDRMFLWMLEKIILVPFIMYIAISLRRLQKGGEALAEGNLDYKTDTRQLIWDLKKHGINLNCASETMNKVVEERTKSERMKTELITNVSHDLNTPLTSIVNYADLISKEQCDNQKITEYSEILVKQSGKMKRLIEDLVEASKASSRNLDVTLEPCAANIFISQAAGEYEEKLSENGLTLITRQPPEEVRIMADGRRMWRIFDNLMNNIMKYALIGTRVYLTLEKSPEGAAVFTFRNTSREPLDISADELMERFTRGDHSRNTDGSGLGLSIAKSMAELQGGSLQLIIDGDLFKAVLSMPTID